MQIDLNKYQEFVKAVTSQPSNDLTTFIDTLDRLDANYELDANDGQMKHGPDINVPLDVRPFSIIVGIIGGIVNGCDALYLLAFTVFSITSVFCTSSLFVIVLVPIPTFPNTPALLLKNIFEDIGRILLHCVILVESNVFTFIINVFEVLIFCCLNMFEVTLIKLELLSVHDLITGMIKFEVNLILLFISFDVFLT